MGGDDYHDFLAKIRAYLHGNEFRPRPEADADMNAEFRRLGADLFVETNAMGQCLRIGAKYLRDLVYDYHAPRSYASECVVRVPFTYELVQFADYAEAAQENGSVIVIKHRDQMVGVRLPHSTLG